MKDNIELETIKLRLEGIRQAINRSRFTLLVLIVTAVAILVTAWNAYLSWDAEFARRPHWAHDQLFTKDKRAERLKDIQEEMTLEPEVLRKQGLDPKAVQSPSVDPKDLTEVTDHAQKELVSEWVKNRIITVGLLGIRVSVDDLPVLGSLSLGIITIWLFYSVRRENRAIATLFRDAYLLKDWHLRYMVYQGVVHHLVLLDLGRGNTPINDFKTEEPAERNDAAILRGALTVLFYLPTLSVFFVLLMDILTLFYLSAPFRPSHETLWRLLGPSDWIKVIAMEAIAITLLAFTTFVSYKIRTFLTATEDLVKEYRAELKRTIGERRISD